MKHIVEKGDRTALALAALVVAALSACSATARADEVVIEPAEQADASAELPPPFRLRAGFAVTHRSFTYNDDVFGALRPYELPAAPVVTAGLAWFPGGHADLGLLAGLSLRAEGELALGVETVGANGAVFGTQMWAAGVGVRYALPIDDVRLFVEGGYRGYGFSISGAGEDERPDVPNVEIHAVRAGAGFRWDIGSGLFFSGEGAYLAPLALGEIASDAWFPRASAGGVEAGASFGLRIDEIELRASFGMRRFFYAMNPEPGDARVAGGAVDQSFTGALDLTWLPRF